MRRMVMSMVMMLAIVACAQAGSPGAGDSASSSQPATTSTTRGPDTTPPTSLPTSETDVVLAAAVEDLLSRGGVEVSDIEVIAFEAGQWNDGSLGCPEEGFSYTQALVQGYRIKLMANGTLYVYAQGGDAPVFYCEQPNEDGFKTEFTLPEPSIPPPID